MSDLPNGWVCVPAGDICEIVGGSTPKTAEPRYWGGEITWITPDDLSKHRSKVITTGARSITVDGYASCSARMLPAGTVLYTTRAPIGYVAIADGPVCTNQGFKSFIPPVGLASDYLYWYFRYATPEIRKMGSGTTFAEISAKVARTIPILVPPTREQHRIVQAIEEQFSRLDAGVASLQRAKRNLARMRASVLTAAVTGRLVPHEMGEEAPNPSGDSGLPSGWEWKKIEDIAGRVTVGYVGPMKQAYVQDGVPFLRSMNVRPNRFEPQGLIYIDPSFEATLSKSRLTGGDVLVVRSGAVGVACVVPKSMEHANCSDLVVIKSPKAVPEFICYYMNSAAQRLVRRGQTGVALIHFNTKSVAALPIPIPPIPEQRRIVEEVERQFSILDAIEASIEAGLARADRLRQSILRDAFAGRLVPQDPTDEPASVLLKRINSERATA